MPMPLALFYLQIKKKQYRFATAYKKHLGTLAQLVEHRTENPGVPGSIPGGTTKYEALSIY